VQNSNPSQNHASVPFPFCLDDAVARAYTRARDACAGSEPTADDIHAAYAAEQGAKPTEDPGDSPDIEPDADIDDSESTDTARFDVRELLLVLRGPIEWVFTLAERATHGDPVDLAAIGRVRDAIRIRLASAIASDDVPVDGSRIRSADLLTVAGLLLGTLDPAIVQRAATGIGSGIAHAITKLLELEPSLASYLPYVAGLFARRHTPQSAGPHGSTSVPRAAPSYFTYGAPVGVSFVEPLRAVPSFYPYAAPVGLPSPFAESFVSRPAVPACCWAHGRVL
jgi:hypothetical protein